MKISTAHFLPCHTAAKGRQVAIDVDLQVHLPGDPLDHNHTEDGRARQDSQQNRQIDAHAYTCIRNALSRTRYVKGESSNSIVTAG